MKINEWFFSLPVLMSTLVFVMLLGLDAAVGSEDAPYGTTWQIKCDQQGTGKEAQCWMVEVPNQPVPGIDVPFEEKK